MNRYASSIIYALLATSSALAQQAEIPQPEQLWAHRMIGLDAARSRGISGKGFTIGVVDNIIQAHHPEFGGRVTDGFDIFGGPYLPVGFHGTHVAGTIAGHNVGLSNQSRIVGINILDDPAGRGGIDARIASGYHFGLRRGVRAFNNSWEMQDRFRVTIPITGMSRDQFKASWPGLDRALREANAAGAIQVFATGNSALPQPSLLAGMPVHYPEYRPYWLAVTAVGPDASLASYANRCGIAAEWCLAAPGGDGARGSDEAIWSAWPDDGYFSIQGTSMAAPHVTGALGLAAEFFPVATNPQLVQLVLQTATDLGDPGVDPVYGWGLLNVGAIAETIEPRTVGSFANAAWSRFASLGHAGSAMRQRLMLDEPAIWGVPISGHASISAGPGSRSASSRTSGFLVGADVVSTEATRVGIAAGYTNTRLEMRGIADRARADGLHLGAYGLWRGDRLYLQGTAQAAYFDQTLARHEIAGAAGTSGNPIGRSSLRGSALEADARLGYVLEFENGMSLAPHFAMAARHQNTRAAEETGAGIFSLSLPGTRLGQFEFGPGLDWQSAPLRLDRASLRFQVAVAYARLSGDVDHTTEAKLLGRAIQGGTGKVGRDVLRLGGRVNVASPDGGLSGFVGYDGRIQRRTASHSISVGARIRF